MLKVIDAQGRLKTNDLGVSLPLAVTNGGTGLSATAQGDMLYADASNSLAKLAKNTTASRYLSNQGSSNNPAWNTVDLTNGVTGVLPTTNGGTGLGIPGTFIAATGYKWVGFTELLDNSFSGTGTPSFTFLGWNAQSITEDTQSGVVDTAGRWYRSNVNATAGNVSRIFQPSLGGFAYSDHNPTARWKFRTGSDITNVRIWIALVDANFSNADDQSARKGFGVVYSTVRGDTGWMTWKATGAAQTVGSQVAAIASSTLYKVAVSLSGGDGGTVTIDINGTSATFTGPTITGVPLFLHMEMFTTTASTKSWDFASVYAERD